MSLPEAVALPREEVTAPSLSSQAAVAQLLRADPDSVASSPLRFRRYDRIEVAAAIAARYAEAGATEQADALLANLVQRVESNRDCAHTDRSHCEWYQEFTFQHIALQLIAAGEVEQGFQLAQRIRDWHLRRQVFVAGPVELAQRGQLADAVALAQNLETWDADAIQWEYAALTEIVDNLLDSGQIDAVLSLSQTIRDDAWRSAAFRRRALDQIGAGDFEAGLDAISSILLQDIQSETFMDWLMAMDQTRPANWTQLLMQARSQLPVHPSGLPLCAPPVSEIELSRQLQLAGEESAALALLDQTFEQLLAQQIAQQAPRRPLNSPRNPSGLSLPSFPNLPDFADSGNCQIQVVKVFADIAFQYRQAEQTESATAASKAAVEIIQRLNRPQQKMIGWGYVAGLGDREPALSYVKAAAMEVSVEEAEQAWGKIMLDWAQRGLVSEALVLLTQIQSADQRARVQQQIAIQLVEQGDISQALSITQQIPRDWYRVAVATDLANRGQFSAALQLAQTLTDLDTQGKALRAIAVKLAQSGNFEQAQEVAQMIAEPDSQALAWVEIADAAIAAQRIDIAQQLVQLMLAGPRPTNNPAPAIAYRQSVLREIAISLAKAGNVTAAEQVVQILEAQALEDRAWILTHIAAQQTRMGDTQAARLTLSQACQILSSSLDSCSLRSLHQN